MMLSIFSYSFIFRSNALTKEVKSFVYIKRARKNVRKLQRIVRRLVAFALLLLLALQQLLQLNQKPLLPKNHKVLFRLRSFCPQTAIKPQLTLFYMGGSNRSPPIDYRTPILVECPERADFS